jgi:hypothetical protein
MGKRRERVLMRALGEVLDALDSVHVGDCEDHNPDNDDEGGEGCSWCCAYDEAWQVYRRVQRELTAQRVAREPPAVPTATPGRVETAVGMPMTPTTWIWNAGVGPDGLLTRVIDEELP